MGGDQRALVEGVSCRRCRQCCRHIYRARQGGFHACAPTHFADRLVHVAAIKSPTHKRVSFEAELLKALRESIADLHVVGVSDQGANNKFDVPGWDLPPLRQFQYGDFRIELPTTTVIVETESAGGIGNLVKYWPLLRSGQPAKRLVILHVYMLSSDADYIAHRKLWSFLVERMTEDLTANGVSRPERWDAHLGTYRKGGSPDEVTALLRKAVLESEDAAHSRAAAQIT